MVSRDDERVRILGDRVDYAEGGRGRFSCACLRCVIGGGLWASGFFFFLYVCRSGGCSWRVNGGLDDGCVDVKGR
jgi:hypothetical protein